MKSLLDIKQEPYSLEEDDLNASKSQEHCQATMLQLLKQDIPANASNTSKLNLFHYLPAHQQSYTDCSSHAFNVENQQIIKLNHTCQAATVSKSKDRQCIKNRNQNNSVYINSNILPPKSVKCEVTECKENSCGVRSKINSASKLYQRKMSNKQNPVGSAAIFSTKQHQHTSQSNQQNSEQLRNLNQQRMYKEFQLGLSGAEPFKQQHNLTRQPSSIFPSNNVFTTTADLSFQSLAVPAFFQQPVTCTSGFIIPTTFTSSHSIMGSSCQPVIHHLLTSSVAMDNAAPVIQKQSGDRQSFQNTITVSNCAPQHFISKNTDSQLSTFSTCPKNTSAHFSNRHNCNDNNQYQDQGYFCGSQISWNKHGNINHDNLVPNNEDNYASNDCKSNAFSNAMNSSSAFASQCSEKISCSKSSVICSTESQRRQQMNKILNPVDTECLPVSCVPLIPVRKSEIKVDIVPVTDSNISAIYMHSNKSCDEVCKLCSANTSGISDEKDNPGNTSQYVLHYLKTQTDVSSNCDVENLTELEYALLQNRKKYVSVTHHIIKNAAVSDQFGNVPIDLNTVKVHLDSSLTVTAVQEKTNMTHLENNVTRNPPVESDVSKPSEMSRTSYNGDSSETKKHMEDKLKESMMNQRGKNIVPACIPICSKKILQNPKPVSKIKMIKRRSYVKNPVYRYEPKQQTISSDNEKIYMLNNIVYRRLVCCTEDPNIAKSTLANTKKKNVPNDDHNTNVTRKLTCNVSNIEKKNYCPNACNATSLKKENGFSSCLLEQSINPIMQEDHVKFTNQNDVIKYTNENNEIGYTNENSDKRYSTKMEDMKDQDENSGTEIKIDSVFSLNKESGACFLASKSPYHLDSLSAEGKKMDACFVVMVKETKARFKFSQNKVSRLRPRKACSKNCRSRALHRMCDGCNFSSVSVLK